MQERKFKIVKLTPIALASCERCNTTFQSYQRVEDEAEREMRALFDRHYCEAAVIPGEND
jgi:NMD protein affecting ribosome stability and mRNA decay